MTFEDVKMLKWRLASVQGDPHGSENEVFGTQAVVQGRGFDVWERAFYSWVVGRRRWGVAA